MPSVVNVIAATQLSQQQLELTQCFSDLPACKASYRKVNCRSTGVAQPSQVPTTVVRVSISMSEITSKYLVLTV